MRGFWLAAALFGAAVLAHAQTASPSTAAPLKESTRKLLQLQKPGIEALARSVVERPAAQLIQGAAQAIQTRVPAEQREALSRTIDADVKKFVDESTPLLAERAVKLAPLTLGAALEQKFSEDEIKQLITWFESPLNRKYQQFLPEVQNSMLQKVLAEAATLLEPRLKALQERTRTQLLAAMTGPADGAAVSASPAAPPSSKAAPK
jgi:uncharacterized protein